MGNFQCIFQSYLKLSGDLDDFDYNSKVEKKNKKEITFYEGKPKSYSTNHYIPPKPLNFNEISQSQELGKSKNAIVQHNYFNPDETTKIINFNEDR